MKKRFYLIYGILCFILIISCRNDNSININLQESKHFYSMEADFSKANSGKVESYLDDQLGKGNEISFANTKSDATLTLDDGTKFYMKKYPGYLEIKLNKDENSYESYKKVKAMCEGLKKIVTK